MSALCAGRTDCQTLRHSYGSCRPGCIVRATGAEAASLYERVEVHRQLSHCSGSAASATPEQDLAACGPLATASLIHRRQLMPVHAICCGTAASLQCRCNPGLQQVHGFLSRTYVPLACPTVDKSCSTTHLWIERALRKPYSSQESSIYR